jgi:hypothetical protein
VLLKDVFSHPAEFLRTLTEEIFRRSRCGEGDLRILAIGKPSEKEIERLAKEYAADVVGARLAFVSAGTVQIVSLCPFVSSFLCE